MKKTLLIACILLTNYQSLFAQKSRKQEVVYLHNGSMIRGHIIDSLSSKVNIEILGGSRLAYDRAEVDSIRIQDVSLTALNRFQTEYYRRDKGYHSAIDAGLLFGTKNSDVVSLTQLHITQGYRFWPYLCIGVGVGIDHFDNYGNLNFVPLYAHIESNLVKSRITPFVFADLGYAFTWITTAESVGLALYRKQGGLYGSAGIGMRIHTQSRLAVKLALAYTHHEMRTQFNYSRSSDLFEQKLVLHRLGLLLGFSF
jgi:hypothetical protein